MTNFDALPGAHDPLGGVLSTRMAEYVDTPGFAATRAHTLNAVHAGPRRYILEVGPGAGASTRALVASGATVAHMDASAWFTTRVQPDGSNGVLADIIAVPLRTNSLDAVLIDRVLHHVPNLETALGELRRITTPGGTVASSVPDLRTVITNAPPDVHAALIAASRTIGGLTARPDAAAVLDTADGDGWELIERQKFDIDGEPAVTYCQPVKRCEQQGGDELAAHCQTWLDSGHAQLTLSLIAHTYTVTR